MPVTTYPSPQRVGQNRDETITTSEALLATTSQAWSATTSRAWPNSQRTNKRAGPETRPILQTSFSDLNQSGEAIIPYKNGFVDGIIRAFNQDLHLTLRPDDVWLAILIQFNYFVNGKAEILRSQFVAHEGKKQLIVDVRPFSLRFVEMGKFAQVAATLIQDNIKDPKLKEWIIPNFSTTTDRDRSVASVVMMGTFQKYFEYFLGGGCGLPSVTLLGEKSDWQSLRTRLDKLPQYHEETAAWAKLLIPIIDHMVATFDEPDSQKTKDFWMRCAFEAGAAGSGTSFVSLSGWITAFCFWGDDGKRTEEYTDEMCMHRPYGGVTLEERKRLDLDGVRFPLICPKAIPTALITVPVMVKDYEEGIEYKTTMVAGLVGVTVNRDGNQVQPRSGWWVLEDQRKELKNMSMIENLTGPDDF
ncbi:hypothetical protein F5884DRAFT_406833 [Xylogone sp. PMI_703]|nr:hypothetical protein F5884DRAFT_406833 [Xylogone sp. PMI_703]